VGLEICLGAKPTKAPRGDGTAALTCPSSGNAWHLKSRHPFVPAAQQLISSYDDNKRSAALWADHRCNAEWMDKTTRLRTFISDIGTHPSGISLPRTVWVRLNRLHTGMQHLRLLYA